MLERFESLETLIRTYPRKPGDAICKLKKAKLSEFRIDTKLHIHSRLLKE
jgi:hypothetical protein